MEIPFSFITSSLNSRYKCEEFIPTNLMYSFRAVVLKFSKPRYYSSRQRLVGSDVWKLNEIFPSAQI